MMRPFLALLLGQAKPVTVPAIPIGIDAGAGLPPERTRAETSEPERLPPRGDSFYLGLCFSHW